MKCTIFIDKEKNEEVLIYAHEKTSLIERIEKLALSSDIEIIGYTDQIITKLIPTDICCFIVENNKIFALTMYEKFQIKQRLYEIETILDDNFVKINQSCIVNIEKIERFNASVAGSLMVTLKNNYKDYISRRQLKIVKERIGFKK